MKILISLGGYFPAQTYGGPPVSIDNLCTLLSDEIEFFILTTDHELNKTQRLEGIHEGWNNRGNCKVKYLRITEDDIKSYRETVDEINPDIIYINSLFAKRSLCFLKIAKDKNIQLLLASRGELCVNGFNKKYKKIPYLFLIRKFLVRSNVWYQSTSEEEDVQIAKILKVSPDKIFRLTNIPQVPPRISVSPKKDKGACKLIFLSRIEAKKNLYFALKILKDVKAEVNFDIYGPKEDLEYWEKCENIIRQLPQNIHVTYRGKIQHKEVHKTFSKYHTFLFPTISENYGHVLVESMLSGCPVITSDQVPWTDVNQGNAGWCLPLDRPDLFVNAINEVAGYRQEEFDNLRERCGKYIHSHIDIEGLKQSYLDAFNKIAYESEFKSELY